jgi:Xaa-Pro aminopeptidase
MDMYAERRQRFLEAIGPGVAVFPSASPAIRNQDVEFPYRQDSDFYYLTGFEEPHSVLLLTNQHPEHRAVLFVQSRNPEREVWDGPRCGVDGAVSDYGMDAAFPIEELDEHLADYLADVHRLHYRVGKDRAFDDRVFAALDRVRRRARHGVRAPGEIVDPGLTVHEMRMRKSPDELASMRRAVEITADAHRRAMARAEPGRHEYEVEAELLRTFHAHGSPREAYPSIVGSGPNATILHYRDNRRRMQDGDLLLIDAGCEYDYYASDVTRTFPINGKFTADQRSVYELVLAAQKAAISAVKPGATLQGVHEAALHILVDGMIELGLLSGKRDEIIENGDYKKFFVHRTSHWIGMDVHDVGTYFHEGQPRELEPGFVLTVEPGLYVPPDADVDARWRGMGVRIEDDVLVTTDGHEVLSEEIPKAPQDVEAAASQRL